MISLLIWAACARPGAGTELALFECSPKTVVVLEITGRQELPDLPDGLAWSRFSRTDRYSDNPMENLLLSADSSGKLLMLLEREPGTELPGATRQHMFITLDDLHRPVIVSPEGLALDLNETSITPGPEGHGAVILLLEKYRPDLLFISIDDPGPDSLSALLAFWSESATIRDFRFVLLSAPSSESRGWCAMNWRGIQGGFIPGLSFGGFEKTLAILVGLPWDQSVFSGVPAATVLNTREQNP
ncbi:MAG: hypothetical protein R6V62_01895 [Candidatus Fermentibacteraceae bacterium]